MGKYPERSQALVTGCYDGHSSEPEPTKQLQRHSKMQLTATRNKSEGGSLVATELEDGSWCGGQKPPRHESMADVKTKDEDLHRPMVNTYSPVCAR